MQCLSLMLIFNVRSENRKPFYANKSFLCYTSVLLVYSLLLVSFNFSNFNFFGKELVILDDTAKGKELENEINRALLLITASAYTFTAFMIETGINAYFDKLNRRKLDNISKQ